MNCRVKREIPGETWDEYYRRYQRRLADDYLIPVLERWGIGLAGKRMLEVGCGDGGCSAAFHDRGCDVVAMDIDERLVGLAEAFNRQEGARIKAFVGDVYDEGGPFYREGPFDIVMLRDVMEHLEEPVKALGVIKRNLEPDGVVFIVFPPYYSPYGAHQQILPRKKIGFVPVNKLPYVHLLPDALFLPVIRGGGAASEEVERLRNIRLTIRRFEKSAGQGGFRVARRRLYLSRPTFALRYGLPVVGAGPLGWIPLVREALVTAAYYLLEQDNEKTRPR